MSVWGLTAVDLGPVDEDEGGGFTAALRLTLGGHGFSSPVQILNYYNPTGCRDFSWLAPVVADGSWIVLGDFNKRDGRWEEGYPTFSSAVGDALSEANLTVLNDGSFTRVPDRADHSRTAIDLCLAVPDLVPCASWSVSCDPAFSDHLPILIRLDGRPLSATHPPLPPARVNWERVDWDGYATCLESFVLPTGLSVDETAEACLRDAITFSLARSAPAAHGRPARVSKPWWTDDYWRAVRSKRQAYKRYQALNTPDRGAG